MSVETGQSRMTLGLTLGLALIGVSSLELSICGMVFSDTTAILRASGVALALMVVFFLLGRRTFNHRVMLTQWESVAIVGLALLPFVWHPCRVAISGGGVILETMMLEGLRNLGFGLGVLSRRSSAARLSTVVSLFGVLVGSSMVEGAVMTSLAVAFGVLGTAWLLVGYWSGLPKRATISGRPPLVGAGVVLAVAVAIPALILVGPNRAASALLGLVPTSGGSDWSDPDARSGVGDGPNEVEALESADSVGFSQSEVYLETDKPSLYDAFSDTFGEPIKKKKQERAVALSPNEIQRRRKHPSEDHRAGREFTTHRKPPRPQDPPGAEADALVYVRGRAPAHLRLVAYDSFDGISWSEGLPPSAAGSGLRTESDRSPWLLVDSIEQPYLSGRVRHRVKLGMLDTSGVPAPAHLDRFRVGSVNRTDFFERPQPGILRMCSRTIPPGTVIDTEARTPLPELLQRLHFPERLGYAFLRHRKSPEGMPIIHELASDWGAGVPRGWEQVEAVVSHLRGHCEYDRFAVPPKNCPDPVAHFLVESRQGPDYLFATAAALMLRSLNYPTRVVGGLYVDPDQYDPIARHIAVTSEDAHLWVEVQVPGGDWVTIEPTPGFELMAPAYNTTDRLLAILHGVVRWGKSNAAALSLSALVLGLLAWRRREVLDRVWTLAWSISSRLLAPSKVVLTTLRLIERRASWAGIPRAIGETPTRWCHQIVPPTRNGLVSDLKTLIRLAQWSVFAPEPLPPEFDSDTLCRRVVQSWTLRTFQETSRPDDCYQRGLF